MSDHAKTYRDHRDDLLRSEKKLKATINRQNDFITNQVYKNLVKNGEYAPLVHMDIKEIMNLARD